MLQRVSTPTPGLLLIVQQKIVTQRGIALPQGLASKISGTQRIDDARSALFSFGIAYCKTEHLPAFRKAFCS
jgi:hypothetical protein